MEEFNIGVIVEWHGYDATITYMDEEGTIVLDVCGEEVYTDYDEVMEQQY